MAKHKTEPERLKGWLEIARFLGQPVSVAQRWAKTGMPVTREGRHVQASPEHLNRWLGKEVSESVQIATEATDLSAELKRGLAFVRRIRHAGEPNAHRFRKIRYSFSRASSNSVSHWQTERQLNRSCRSTLMHRRGLFSALTIALFRVRS